MNQLSNWLLNTRSKGKKEMKKKVSKVSCLSDWENESESEVKSLSHVWLFATPWTVAYQAPPSMGFSRHEYWSGLPFPSPGGSSQPRDQIQGSCSPGRCFNLWATRFISLGSFITLDYMAQRLKHLPAMLETWIRSLCQEDPLEKEMATHSSILAWRIPWREEPGRLLSTG